MKLSHLKESVHDHNHFALLQKVAVELGYQRLQLHDSSYYFDDDSEGGRKWHYDASSDIDTAILISRMPMGDDKVTVWDRLQSLANLRQLDINDLTAPEKVEGTPLERLRGVKELAQAYRTVEREQEWVRTSAENVIKVLKLLNGLKTWSKKEADRGSDDSMKITIAKTTLKKLGIPLEGD